MPSLANRLFQADLERLHSLLGWPPPEDPDARPTDGELEEMALWHAWQVHAPNTTPIVC